MIASNLVFKDGEIDLLADDHGVRVAVEVRTRIGGGDPIDAIDQPKRDHVIRLARRAGATRVDLIGIRLDSGGVDIHWVPAA